MTTDIDKLRALAAMDLRSLAADLMRERDALLDELAALRKVAEAAEDWSGFGRDDNDDENALMIAVDAYRAWKAGRK